MKRVLIATPIADKTGCMKFVREAFCDVCEVAFCTDGNALHDVMQEFDPEMLFLDLHMPNTDGLTLLQDIRLSGNTVPVVITANYLQGSIVAQLIQLNITSIVQGPLTIEKMIDELGSLLQFIEEESAKRWSPEAELDYILIRLGFRCGVQFSNIHQCIMQKYINESMSLTKEIYPSVANFSSGSAYHIEKGLRDGIRRAMNSNSANLWRAYFPALPQGKCPTNEEFLCRMAQALRNRERPQKMRENIFENVLIG